LGIGHRRQAAAASLPDSALLSLAQALGIAGQRWINVIKIADRQFQIVYL
jgi:hypothetical protein